MNEKQLKGMFTQKTDTLARWTEAGQKGFVPKKGEIIVYQEEGSKESKFKIGDGVTTVDMLPYAQGEGDLGAQSDWNENDEYSDAYVKNRTHWYKPEIQEGLLASFRSIAPGEEILLIDQEDKNYFSLSNYTYLIVYINGEKFSNKISCQESEESDWTLTRWFAHFGQVIVEEDNTYACTHISNHSNSSISLEVYNAQPENYHKLDKNYLPNEIAYKEEIPSLEGVAWKEDLKGLATELYVKSSYTIAGQRNGTTLGNKATAEGQDTIASGDFSHAEGKFATASGERSHAEGLSSQATGIDSHAEGNSTDASGTHSHAEGSNTTASGPQSHAEGGRTKAIGSQSHAEGLNTNATGNNSHAEGSNTTAFGAQSHTEGYNTNATGNNSHAEGNGTKAIGSQSHAEGYNTIASANNSHVQGKYNVEDTDKKYAHIVGNGDAEGRSNAHTLDWNGNAWFKGGVYVGGTSQDDAVLLTAGGSSDWNENNEASSSYIKNRTHWLDKDLGEVLFDKTITGRYYADFYLETGKNLEDGKNYLITVNDTEECISTYNWYEPDDPSSGPGSGSMHGAGVFCFDDPGSGSNGIEISATAYPCKIKIQEVTSLNYHKLDKNYLPSDIAYKNDIVKQNWLENDKNSRAYIMNKTHGMDIQTRHVYSNPNLSASFTAYEYEYEYFSLDKDKKYLITVNGEKHIASCEYSYYKVDGGIYSTTTLSAGDVIVTYKLNYDIYNISVSAKSYPIALVIEEIENITYHKLDKNYLPDNLATTEYVDEEIATFDFIKVVDALPESGLPNRFYLVPKKDSDTQDLFDEYIWVNDAWEHTATKQMEVDLTGYVKTTDYATDSVGGVIKSDNRYATRMVNGVLDICAANKNVIDTRTPMENPLYAAGVGNRHTIVSSNLDYAVKKALADCRLADTAHAWTEEEKQAARALLGAVPTKTSDRTSVYAVNSKGEQIIIGTSPNAANNGMIPIYNKNGTINVSTPATDQQSANKGYVDGLVGNIETALDAIITIQNSILGGDK